MTARYRQEHKYRISLRNMELLRTRLRCFMQPDKNADRDGGYWIRSLYFDDRNYTAFRDKLDGVKERSKFRMRFYNFNDSYIVLEKKERSGDLCRKSTQRISRELAERIANGQRSGGGSVLLDEFDMSVSQGLHPVMLVDYHRYAFSSSVSNTRITLDSHLQTPVHELDFFNKNLPEFPVFEDQEALIEVKFDHFVPPYIAEFLEGVPKVKIAVSKYTRCLSMLVE